jgi:hypothetical protein
VGLKYPLHVRALSPLAPLSVFSRGAPQHIPTQPTIKTLHLTADVQPMNIPVFVMTDARWIVERLVGIAGNPDAGGTRCHTKGSHLCAFLDIKNRDLVSMYIPQ